MSSLGQRRWVPQASVCAFRSITSSNNSPASATSTQPTSGSNVCPNLSKRPTIGRNVFIAHNATLLGDVTLADDSSVFYGCVLRADINAIVVGPRSNIQDNTVIHLSSTKPTKIGELVTIGHNAIIHACEIGNRVLVGMGAIIMDGCTIPDDCIVAAGAVVPMGKTFEPNSLILGSPATAVRKLKPEERQNIILSAEKYVLVQAQHRQYQKTVLKAAPTVK